MSEEAEVKYADEAHQKIQKLVAFEPESLRRTEELGAEHDFSNVVGLARNVIDMHAPISVRILEQLTDRQSRVFLRTASQALDVFNGMLHYNPPKDSTEDRDRLIKGLRGVHDDIFSSYAGLYASVHAVNANFPETKKEIEQDKQKFVEVIKDSRDELEKFRKDAAKSLAQHEIDKQSAYFAKEAKEHRNSAWFWLVLTILSAGLLVCGPIIADIISGSDKTMLLANNARIAEVITTRFIVFGALGYLLVLCGKTYLSHKHNQVVNTHRYMALLTFEALANGAISEDAADDILRHAAACIYSPQTSGYAKGGDKLSIWPGSDNTKQGE